MAAVEALLRGYRGEMVGLLNDEIAFTPFEHAAKHNTDIDPNMLRIVEMLSL